MGPSTAKSAFCLRTEALATMRPLITWLSRLEHDLRVTSVPLTSLVLQDVVQLVQALAGGGTPTREDARADLERLGKWLFAETHGQPFYVTETLNALLGQGMLTLRPSVDGRRTIGFTAAARNEAGLRGMLPAGVCALIQARLAQLSLAAFALLAAGSVLEHDFTFQATYTLSNEDTNVHEERPSSLVFSRLNFPPFI